MDHYVGVAFWPPLSKVEPDETEQKKNEEGY